MSSKPKKSTRVVANFKKSSIVIFFNLNSIILFMSAFFVNEAFHF